MFEQCLAALARRGRQIEISSGGMPKVGFDITNFYHNESRLIGVDSLKWGFAEAAQILRELIPAFENGDLPLPEVKAAPLESGPEVYRQIDAGTIREKVVLVP
jgi:NADPH:quinone reductase-like Zn-dependent oxidoreductase